MSDEDEITPLSIIPPDKRVIIIGGGVGGLTVAAKLKTFNEYDVTIYEKNDKVGGRCSAFRHEGEDEYKFEQGAILYLFHDVYEKVFDSLGAQLDDVVELIKNVDHHKVFLGNGKVFKYSANIDSLAEQLEKITKDVNAKENLTKFAEDFKRVEKFVTDQVFLSTYDTFGEMLSFLWSSICNNFDVLWTAFRYTMYSKIASYFKNDTICQILTFQSLYFGISPFTSSSLFSVLTAYELTTGLKYPKGGMNAITKALEKIATNDDGDWKKRAAKIITNKGVSKIIVKNGRAIGVELDDGTSVKADIVISNADLTYTYKVLLKDQPERSKRANELAKKDHVPSTITFFWGMKKIIPELGAHNIFLSDDYKKMFDDIHIRKKIPDDPSFFIHIANRIDPEMAPEGKDALTVIVPIGQMSTPETRGNFKAEVAKVKKKVIAKLEEKVDKNFANYIEKEFKTTTPDSWRDEFSCWEGNIVGTSHSFNNLLYFRPRQRCEEIKGLYFVGASTQPGAGVPLVMCSALNLATRIRNDLTSKYSNLNK